LEIPEFEIGDLLSYEFGRAVRPSTTTLQNGVQDDAFLDPAGDISFEQGSLFSIDNFIIDFLNQGSSTQMQTLARLM
jgi:hypothetical protein